MNHELPDVQAGFRKGRRPEIKVPISVGSSKKEESSRKTSTYAFDYAKLFDCVDKNKLWEILQEMGIRDHLTCVLRNLYASQELEQQLELDMEQQTGSNRKRSMSRLYIVTLVI